MKHKKPWRFNVSLISIFVGLTLLASLVCMQAAEKKSASESKKSLEDIRTKVKKIGPGRYRLGSLRIHAREKTVQFPGRVNMDEGGPIELLLCLTEGKVHESVLTTDIKPLYLQVALILLNLKPGRNPGLRFYGEEKTEEKNEPPAGDMVEIFVEWEEGENKKKKVKKRAEKLLWDVNEKKPLEDTKWVFVGSRWVKGRFGADVEGSLVTTFYDPFAILEISTKRVNDDTWGAVNQKLCPSKGTDVTIIVRAVNKDGGPAKHDNNSEGNETGEED
ncbi:MAG: hypothetical protein KGZ25_07525 [Planctomycetes bacterium]|nr:hypothetical protein [Planctomycetota bacterium]